VLVRSSSLFFFQAASEKVEARGKEIEDIRAELELMRDQAAAAGAERKVCACEWERDILFIDE